MGIEGQNIYNCKKDSIVKYLGTLIEGPRFIKIILLIIFTIVLFSTSLLTAQSKRKNIIVTKGIKQKQNELSKIKDQITALENELGLKTAKEKESYNVLDNYNRQSFLLHKLIDRLKAEEQEKGQEIIQTQGKISK